MGWREFWRGLWRDGRGSMLVEFAVALPVLLGLYLGSYVLCDEFAAGRKVTITARAITDLVTRYGAMSTDQVKVVMAASGQILVPYAGNAPRVRVSEILVTSATAGRVVWSVVPTTQASDATMPALAACTVVTLPKGMATVNIYLVLGEVSLTYTPPVGLGSQTPTILRDRSYMSPRNVSAIPLSDVTTPTCS
jgi:Flp pilus assembly protein TadG